jgi:hypothetical protein
MRAVHQRSRQSSAGGGRRTSERVCIIIGGTKPSISPELTAAVAQRITTVGLHGEAWRASARS